MKKYIHCAYVVTLLAIAVAGIGLFAGYIHAALVPSLSVSSIVGGTTAQVTVLGADPNASVLLDYPSTASVASVNIGTTNASGYLTANVDAATYAIASGASVYVTVDGQTSPSVVWPSYSGSGSLSFSQSSLVLSPGQSSVVSAGVSASLSMTNNSNPSIAAASITGNQITITGFNAGTTNITICAGSIGCSTIYVTVQSSSANAATVSLTPNIVSIGTGQSQTVGISGSGSYYISNNSNAAVASVSINGSILTVGGSAAGSDVVSVCSSGGSTPSCTSLSINVTQSSFSNVPTTQAPLTFSQSNVNLNVGQTQSIAINGNNAPYYVSTNQTPASATANVSGNNVNLTGLAFGGDNITVCAVSGQCGTFYVYVTTSNTTSTPTPSTLTAPVLSSFAVSSNDLNGSFIGSGNTLTFTFSANQSINIPRVTVGNSSSAANGSGNGPYAVTYVMTGAETFPLPVTIAFSNPAGSAGQANFWIGGTGTAAPAASTANTTTVSSANATFTEYLYNGSAGSQVTALQERLKSDGIYSGPVTGTFGNLTEAAVKIYQARHSLQQLGVVGPATRVLLNSGI